MKHLIIFNSAAGEGKAKDYLPNIEYSFNELDYEVHITAKPGEATTFLREYLSKYKDPVRVYACGGDGTLNECVNGVYGFDNVELACYAIGTGNDFVKIYGGEKNFSDLITLINGKSHPVDLSVITGPSLESPMYSINVVNIGFDAIVGAYGNLYKEKGKKDPYSKAILPAIFKGRFNKIKVTVDGEVITKKKMLLCSAAHGQYIGGKYRCAPRSVNTDGLIDICLFHTMTIFGFLGILNAFTEGKHFEKKNYQKKIVYRQVKHVLIESEKEMDICVDGEMLKGKTFEIKSLPGAIRFVIPE